VTLLAVGATARAAPPPDAARTAPAAAAGTSAGTSAATSADLEVDEHVAQGHRLYLFGRYQDAIAEYRRAYELRADAQFLLPIAESYRQLGASEQALFYYERYLSGAPPGPERDVAEQRVSELESLRAGATPGLGVAGGAGLAATEKHPTPLWRRWWLWAALGVALVAGTTAAALAGRSESSTPATDLGVKKFF
jgi:tetratricopeptide (TPR) repeat protein